MFRKNGLSRRGLVYFIIGAFCALLVPLEVLAGASAGAGDLVGFIYKEDLKVPLEGAFVKVRGVESGLEYTSLASDKTGLYKLTGVPEGKYIVGVTTIEGNYNLEVMIRIKGGETAKLPLVLKAGEPMALLTKNTPKAAFFATPLGIALLAGASAAAVVAEVGALTKTNPSPASPIKR